MSPEGSVTRWLNQLQQGDSAAAQALWERYFLRLVGLARKKLAGAARQVADEEDVALSAFDSFFRNAELGRFPQLADRDSLWHLLVTITMRKASHLIRDAQRLKRGGPRDLDEEELTLENVFSREPGPDLAAQVAEEYQRLLDSLADPELRLIAVWKMEGHSVEEIGQRLNYAPRSIKRKLQLIRGRWEKEVSP